MTHNYNRAHWLKEGVIGMASGVSYGVTSVLVGQPFDTVKTKMQAQGGFFQRTTMVSAFKHIVQTQGIVGLYRGCVPALLGSGIIRSIQFAGFEATYTFFQNSSFTKEIPYTGGLQIRVIAGGMVGATARALIECPVEYIKIQRQLQQSWRLRDVYTGLGVTWCRTLPLFTTFVVMIDSGRRNAPDLFARPILGPFLTCGIAATAAWWIVWPLEYMKSQVQGQFGGQKSVLQRIQIVLKERGGFFGLYRGLLPGSLRSFIANGCSMISMSYVQRKAIDWGLRS